MPRDALPCIVCGKIRPNVDETATNQPYGGLAFTSHGHYGGTVFDPMDGRYLEITVCDDCLVKAAKEQNVLVGQDRKLVTMPGPKDFPMPSVIGTTGVHRALVPWNPEVEDETEAFHIESYDEYVEFAEKIDTRFTPGEIKEMFDARDH